MKKKDYRPPPQRGIPGQSMLDEFFRKRINEEGKPILSNSQPKKEREDVGNGWFGYQNVNFDRDRLPKETVGPYVHICGASQSGRPYTTARRWKAHAPFYATGGFRKAGSGAWKIRPLGIDSSRTPRESTSTRRRPREYAQNYVFVSRCSEIERMWVCILKWWQTELQR